MKCRMTCQAVNATLQNGKPSFNVQLKPVAPPKNLVPNPENVTLWGDGVPSGGFNLERAAASDFTVGADYMVEVTPAAPLAAAPAAVAK